MRPLSKTLLKVLLIWLVALAIPVQAFAASARWGCSAGRAGLPWQQIAGGGVLHTSAAPATPDDSLAPRHPPCHPSVAAESPAQAVSHTAAAAPGKPLPPEGGQHACSACAACFLAAALLPTVPRLAAVDEAVAAVATASVSVAEFTTGGPDRPPRAARG